MRTIAQKMVDKSQRERNDPMKKYRVFINDNKYQIVENCWGACILESGKLWDRNLTEREILESWIMDGKPCISDNEIVYD